MRNAMNGESEVRLADGRVLRVVFDVNTWIDVCDQLGMEMPQVLEALQDEENPPGLKTQRVLFWASLQKHHPEMSLRDAGEIMVEAAEAMAKAISGGLPVAEEGSAGDASEDPMPGAKTRAKRGAGIGSATPG